MTMLVAELERIKDHKTRVVVLERQIWNNVCFVNAYAASWVLTKHFPLASTVLFVWSLNIWVLSFWNLVVFYVMRLLLPSVTPLLLNVILF